MDPRPQNSRLSDGPRPEGPIWRICRCAALTPAVLDIDPFHGHEIGSSGQARGERCNEPAGPICPTEGDIFDVAR